MTFRLSLTTLLIALCCAAPALGQITCIDDTDETPLSEVLFMAPDGSVLGLSDQTGHFHTQLPAGVEITATHIGYADITRALHDGDTLRMKPVGYTLPGVTAESLDPMADYTGMTALVRICQYIDSVPAYYTDAIVDYYIPREGDKLQFIIRSARAYSDEDYIQENKTEAGSVSMMRNGVSNFLSNSPFPLSSDYQVVGNPDDTPASITCDGKSVGQIRKTASGDYELTLDWLRDKDRKMRSLLGRKNTTTLKRLQVTLPHLSPIEELRPGHFLRQRSIIGLTTQYRKKSPAHILNVTDIYPLSLRSLSKAEVKALKPTTDFGNIRHSIEPTITDWESLPSDIPDLPAVISQKVGRSLRLMK